MIKRNKEEVNKKFYVMQKPTTTHRKQIKTMAEKLKYNECGRKKQ